MKNIKKIFILEENKFYCHGLKCLLNDYFKESHIKFNVDSEINKHDSYDIIFISYKKITPSLLLQLSYNKSISPILFLIRENDDVNYSINLPYLHEAVLLYRNDKVETLIERLDIALQSQNREAIHSHSDCYKKRLLTPKDLHILSLIHLGLSNENIAKQLKLSSKTVSSHRINIMKKMKLNSKHELHLWILGHLNPQPTLR